jgi:dihydrodipicolinate reductase
MLLAEQPFHLQTELSQTVHTKVGHLRNQLPTKYKSKLSVLALFLGHTVTYNSNVDSIEIKHTAHNQWRLGAVIAAEWIVGKQGVFTMKDVLELK